MNIFASDLQQYIYLLGGLITMIVLIVLMIKNVLGMKIMVFVKNLTDIILLLLII